jgi:hypothetical protein
MKIAILLRGQPRFASEGARLFDLFFRNRFGKKHDIRVFAHSWNTLSRRMTQTDEVSRQTDREDVDVFTEDEVARIISPWNTTLFSVQSEKVCFDVTDHIIRTRIRREESASNWYLDFLKENELLDRPDYAEGIFIVFPEALEINRHFKPSDLLYKQEFSAEMHRKIQFEHLRYTYLLGQMYSAGKSYQVLEDYIRDIDPAYYPDIVISIRYDSFFWFHDIDKLMAELTSANNIKPTVFVKRITATGGRSVIDDFIFVGTHASLGRLISSPKDRLFDTFTQPASKLLDIIGAGSNTQHYLWSKIADPELNIVQPSITYWNTGVLRPGCFDISGATGTLDCFNQLLADSLKYNYPDVSQPMDADQTDRIWKRLNEE